MATYRKRGNSWQAIVDRKGVYQSQSFQTKAQAVTWATGIEAKIVAGTLTADTQIAQSKTVSDLMNRYAEEVSIKKRGNRWEQIRINALIQMQITLDKRLFLIGDIRLSEFDERFVAAWRDMRSKQVSGSTINREWNIFSNAFKVAIKEWKWIKHNPWHEVKRPKENPARTRIASKDEIEKLIYVAGYQADKLPDTVGARVMAAALFAMQTGMRCKEITQLTPAMVHLDQNIVDVGEDTKTGARQVPLSTKAKSILEQMLKLEKTTVFDLSESQVDAHWRKLTSKAMIDNLTFHDCKHYAVTWMAKKLNIFDLARVVGTKDLKTLQLYYNKTAADIAKDLN